MQQINTRYGKGSKSNLISCHPRLQQLADKALEVANKCGRDITIVEGHRSLERQAKLLAEGFSTLKEGKHNTYPSQALDFAPYHVSYGYLSGHPDQVKAIASKHGTSYETAMQKVCSEYYIIAQCFMIAAAELNIPIRWGGDWDRDNDVFNNTFDDLGHIELLC